MASDHSQPGPAPLGILLIAGDWERAHYAFVLASGGAAIGRRVVLFATNHGCRALLADPGWTEEDAAADAKGVAGLAVLREAALELGVRLIACEAGLRLAGIDGDQMLRTVEVAGVSTFLSAAEGAQVFTL